MTNTRGMRKWAREKLLASNKEVVQDVCEVEMCCGVGAGDAGMHISPFLDALPWNNECIHPPVTTGGLTSPES